jgi:hypothetical protein
LAAFGVTDAPRRLPGGQLPSWLADGIVLKQQGDAAFQQWLGTALAALPRNGFRLAEAVPTTDGAWVCDGWSATRWVVGAPPDPRTGPRWRDVLDAGRAFHRAAAGLTKPAFLDRRTDWWALADRLAWADTAPDVAPELADVAVRLHAALAPLGDPQVVHGDLAGNVLLAYDRPPGIIDVSPYWRPPAYAEGILVADALCWYGAPPSLLPALGVGTAAVARGLLFRLITTHLRALDGVGRPTLREEARRYERAADLIGV